MQSYEVGQIIYLLVKAEMKVIPVRVVEAITRRTLKGAETTYLVQLPDKNKTVSDLNDLDAEIYTDLNHVKQILLEHVTASIESTITRTQMLAKSLASSPGDDAGQ